MNPEEVTLNTRLEEIPLAHEALDAFATRHALPVPMLGRLHVAIEEHLSNIISYGYDPGQGGTIRVHFELAFPFLRVKIEDDGRRFNPMDAPPVDTSLALDKKPVGGLGVHLLRKCVDELSYSRCGERNVLSLASRVTPAS